MSVAVRTVLEKHAERPVLLGRQCALNLFNGDVDAWVVDFYIFKSREHEFGFVKPSNYGNL
jgi:hypothetical protein